MAIRPITDKEFSLLRDFVYQETGINLEPPKKALLVGRLTPRLNELGLKSFGEYYRRVKGGDVEERVHLLDSIFTNETHFFRQPRQFDFLEQQVFPCWAERAAEGLMPRKIRAWSAACSTGEEPYSLAMALWAHFPPPGGWQIEIVATDLSTRALDRAREAVWPIEKAKEIPERYLKAFMLRGTRSREGKMKAGPEIRSIVRFEKLNLNDEVYHLGGRFDLIFCRNVLIYFDTESKTRVIHRLLNYLAPDGYLFLGQVETLKGLTDGVRSVIPTVYVHGREEQEP